MLPEEYVVDLFPDEGSQAEELAVDAMQHGLEEVALARVFAVEQLQQLTIKKKKKKHLRATCTYS